MATRAAPEGSTRTLSTSQYNAILRFCKTARSERVAVFLITVVARMTALSITRDLDTAANTMPDASDQIDVKSMIDWVNSIVTGDTAAKVQLKAIDATAYKRLNY